MTTLLLIQQRLSVQFRLALEQLQRDSLLSGLGVDSLALIEFVLDLEEEFGIQVPDGQLKIKTLGELVDLLDRLLAEWRGGMKIGMVREGLAVIHIRRVMS